MYKTDVLHSVQATQLCTSTRAKKAVVGFAAFALTAVAIDAIYRYLYGEGVFHEIGALLLKAIVPVAVLVMNMIVIR